MRRFITFEGIEGSGKTTQIQLLSNGLEERGIDHVLTREPGGTPVGDHIRRLVLHPDVPIVPACELLLYAAARAQHIEQIIRPALDEGRVVLCDRFTDATLAYQGYGRGLSIDMIERLHTFGALTLKPDLTLLFDIEPAAALERARSRDLSKTEDETRFERLGLDFHTRVRAGYLTLAHREPDRFVVVDATGSVAEVEARVRASIAGIS